MDVREKLVEQAISHFWYGVSHDIFSEPVKTYAKLAIEALEKENGITVQEWASANEPPKDTCEYWIAYKAGGDYSYSTGYFDGKCWRSALTHHKIPVTHWMPLPEPPKGE